MKTPLQNHIAYCIRQIALYKDDGPNIAHAFLYAKTNAESLLYKEKQMVIDAYNTGRNDMYNDFSRDAEQYFNESTNE